MVVYVSSRLSGTIVTTPALARAATWDRKATVNFPVPAPWMNTTPGRGPGAPTGSVICAWTVAPSSCTETISDRTWYVPGSGAPLIAVDELCTWRGCVRGAGSHCGPSTAPTTASTSTPTTDEASTR